MSLIPWQDCGEKSEFGHPMAGLRREMSRLLDDFFGGGPLAGLQEGSFAPRLDVSETESEVTVTAELPGMEEKEVEVFLSGGRLVISGEKKTEREDKDRAFHVVERSCGKFSRAVDLGGSFDEGKAMASFKDGVLTVKVPRSGKAKPKKIDIKSD